MSDRGYREVIGNIGGLRRGLTTGTCAQAASKAAACALISGERADTVSIALPPGKKEFSGRKIAIPVSFYREEGEWMHAGIVKDSGDDDDVTNGALIAARVRKSVTAGVSVAGGKGVGTVTKPGLAVGVGESAVNPVPKKMIEYELGLLLEGGFGFEVEIYVPEGEKLASKTWNPRIGIVGGISIIGTTGVIEPKSSEAYLASIESLIGSAAKRGLTGLAVTPGYVGERYLVSNLRIPEEFVVTVGDHIGWTCEACARQGIRHVMLVGHIGKISKVACGIFNTHWSSGDGRLETIAAWASVCGAGPETAERILAMKTAEESVGLLSELGLKKTFSLIARKTSERIETLTKGALTAGCIILDIKSLPIGDFPEGISGEAAWKEYLL